MNTNNEAALARAALVDPLIPELVRAARARARAWQWCAAEADLDAAYHCAGLENPGTGYDLHRGNHPLQRAASPAGMSWMEEITSAG